MRDLTFREGDKLLQNLITNPNKDNKLNFTKHFNERARLRGINPDYVKKMILNNEPLGVLSSHSNRFKIFFPSENNKRKDLIVVIAIEDNNDIIALTTFEDKVTKREGKNDD